MTVNRPYKCIGTFFCDFVGNEKESKKEKIATNTGFLTTEYIT